MNLIDWLIQTPVGNVAFLAIAIFIVGVLVMSNAKKQREVERHNAKVKTETELWMANIETLLEEIRDELRAKRRQDD
ncbi:MAG: hypothetical protein CMJ19_23540 [Phycisphaeraceae bacterium]|nr:hypothetical protein [Phycisphaeraceae bacterium]